MRSLLVAVSVTLALAGCGATTARPDGPRELLAVGETAPDFMALDQDGEVRQLHLLRRRRAAVLFFYPRDGTPGCTAEACALRDSWDRLQAAGAVVVGVSTDEVRAHARFAEEHELPFRLLSDPDAEVLARYGVPSFLGMSQRVTFIIDRDGRIAHVFEDVDPAIHADEIIVALEALGGAPVSGATPK